MNELSRCGFVLQRLIFLQNNSKGVNYFVWLSYTHEKEEVRGMNLMRTIQKRIAELCEQQNVTLNYLCTHSGLAQSCVSSILGADRRNVRISTLEKICWALNVSLADFFDSDLFRGLNSD